MDVNTPATGISYIYIFLLLEIIRSDLEAKDDSYATSPSEFYVGHYMKYSKSLISKIEKIVLI